MQANAKLTSYALGAAVVGPLIGVAGANLYTVRKQRAIAARQLAEGLTPSLPRSRGFAFAVVAGLASGLLTSDFAIAYGARQANHIIETEGDAARIHKAMRAASAEVLRSHADELEGLPPTPPSAGSGPRQI